VALHGRQDGRRLRRQRHQAVLRAVRRLQRREACEAQFRNAFLQGCVGAWSLHPSQIAIAKRVFSPEPDEVRFALRILEAMPDGTGAAMIDGKMQDDATWKQARVIVDLARIVAARDPELAEAYGLSQS
jgi:malyl-CoA/(S)-citramalyl-CoA lyase